MAMYCAVTAGKSDRNRLDTPYMQTWPNGRATSFQEVLCAFESRRLLQWYSYPSVGLAETALKAEWPSKAVRVRALPVPPMVSKTIRVSSPSGKRLVRI